MNYRTLEKLIEFAVADAPNINHNFKHFSFIVERNKILSIGRNDPNKTHPMANKFGHRFNCIHSELSALVNFPRPNTHLKNCDIINIRVRSDDTIGISRPCNICAYMLRIFKLRNVYYTNRGGEFEKLN